MSILKTWKAKAVMASALVLTALPASAEGWTDIGTEAAKAMSQFVTVVSTIGLAALSVIIAVSGIKTAFNMVRSIGR
jgi:hypothetical protein|nr:MAG TPA: hypothetical protein [Inoviridae sp.]